jgi:hypothetical protein
VGSRLWLLLVLGGLGGLLSARGGLEGRPPRHRLRGWCRRSSFGILQTITATITKKSVRRYEEGRGKKCRRRGKGLICLCLYLARPSAVGLGLLEELGAEAPSDWAIDALGQLDLGVDEVADITQRSPPSVPFLGSAAGGGGGLLLSCQDGGT